MMGERKVVCNKAEENGCPICHVIELEAKVNELEAENEKLRIDRDNFKDSSRSLIKRAEKAERLAWENRPNLGG